MTRLHTNLARLRSGPAQSRCRFANREVRWPWRACFSIRAHECQRGKVWTELNADTIRYRADSLDRLVAQKPCRGIDPNTRMSAFDNRHDSAERIAETRRSKHVRSVAQKPSCLRTSQPPSLSKKGRKPTLKLKSMTLKILRKAFRV